MTMTAILLGGLALIGVPLTAGFISKLYLIRALIDSGLWAVAALTLLARPSRWFMFGKSLNTPG